VTDSVKLDVAGPPYRFEDVSVPDTDINVVNPVSHQRCNVGHDWVGTEFTVQVRWEEIDKQGERIHKELESGPLCQRCLMTAILDLCGAHIISEEKKS
jgi:hypothetical protein